MDFRDGGKEVRNGLGIATVLDAVVIFLERSISFTYEKSKKLKLMIFLFWIK